eukprot:6047742-Lingulodinium_polyedra.AAC.1
MAYAARSQEKMDWWAEVKADEAKLAKVKEAWEYRCPKIGGKPRANFPIVQYQEELRQERQILTD